MKKFGITKKKLLKEYNQAIDDICEINEEKDTFSGEEVCAIVHGILTKNKVKTSLSIIKLHKLYSDRVESLGLTRSQWVDNYDVPEIIGLLYEILESETLV